MAFVSLMLIPVSFVSLEDIRQQPFVLGNGDSILSAPQFIQRATGARPSMDVLKHSE